MSARCFSRTARKRTNPSTSGSERTQRGASAQATWASPILTRGRTPSSTSVAARVTRWMLDHIGIDHRDFSFIDLGCGKGRVLLGRVALSLPADHRGRDLA